MSYSRLNWEDTPSTKTPINAENLNKMDQGIFSAHEQLDAIPDWAKEEEKPSYTPEDIGSYTKEEIDVLKANAILSKTSGEIVTTTDSANVKPKNIKLFGKGKQRQYEGNQLLNVETYVTNGKYVIEGNAATLHVSGTPTSAYGVMKEFTELPSFFEVGETYTISRIEDYMHLGFWFYDTDGNILTTLTTEYDIYTATIPDNVANVNMYFAGLTEGTTCDFEQNFMLNKGTEALPWEPYVGNEPSPNMNYPQEAEFLGESGSIGGKVLGKNFIPKTQKISLPNFNASDNGTHYGYSDYIEVPSGTKLKTNTDCIVRQFDSSLKMIVDQQTSNKYVTTLENTKYIKIRTTKEISALGEGFELVVTLEVFEATYEPYTEQPFTFQTPNGLRGIPLGQTIPNAIKNSPIHMSGVYWDGEQYQIADTKNENGKYVQRIMESHITSDKGLYMNRYDRDISGSFETSLFFEYHDNRNILSIVWGYALCSRFPNTGRNYDYDVEGLYADNMYVTFRIKNKYLSDVSTQEKAIESMKNLLIDNPITYYYILQDPIITDLTQEELDQYNSLVMNYPNTTIVNDEGAYMEVEYVADTKCYIKQNYVPKEEFEKLQSAVSEIQLALVNS